MIFSFSPCVFRLTAHGPSPFLHAVKMHGVKLRELLWCKFRAIIIIHLGAFLRLLKHRHFLGVNPVPAFREYLSIAMI
jgi:hypothetical protein